jgi:hypothetical protein
LSLLLVRLCVGVIRVGVVCGFRTWLGCCLWLCLALRLGRSLWVRCWIRLRGGAAAEGQAGDR